MAEVFDLTKVPADQLVAFYGLNFAAAAADNEVAKEELMTIFESMDLTSLSKQHKDEVYSFVVNPPDMQEMLRKIRNGEDELRFGVVFGITEVLLADDVITPEERQFLDTVCRQLNVNQEQRDAIINYTKETRRIIINGVDNNAAEKAIKNAGSMLSAVGVPIAAVYFGGSVVGLSAAGITSGLAALGLGLGMVPGIGVAVIAGTAIFLGVRWMLGDSKKDKEEILAAERERKAEYVIKNLQEAINNLVQRMSSLEGKASESDANRESIEILRQRLNALKKALEQRKNRLEMA